MPKYAFKISNGTPFQGTEELADDEAAWREAVLTVRDIETALTSKGGDWSLEVDRNGKTIYRIDVRVRRID